MAEIARADSIRAELAEIRPAADHGTDAIDVITVPFQVVAFPFDVLFVRLPAFVAGQVTVPRPPGFVMRTLNSLAEVGIRPAFYTSIGPRSAPALGFTIDRFDPLQLDAAYSFRGSQRYRIGATWEEDHRYHLDVGVSWRRDGQVGFFGIGPDTPDTEILYRRESLLAGARGWKWFGKFLLEADASYEDNLVGRPRSADEDVELPPGADPSLLFGAEERLHYVRLGGGVGLDFTQRVPFQSRGFRVFGHGTAFRSVYGPESAFHRLHFEANGLIPLNRRQLLALKGRTEFARGRSGQIPFYHLSQLGGEETAIGYPDNRFSDNDLVALTAEWRYEVWRDIHNTRRISAFLYFGEGAVGPRLDEIAASDWHASYGFGLRFERPERLGGLGYLGVSDEGVELNISGEWRP